MKITTCTTFTENYTRNKINKSWLSRVAFCSSQLMPAYDSKHRKPTKGAFGNKSKNK